jgi:thioredoxin-like negative regulator of GroEL
MDAIESQESLSEDKVEQQDLNNARLVPIGESIRHRKRAQSAEKRVEELAGELSESRAEATQLADELKGVQKDQELTKRLAAAGARDLEAAVLIAKSRLGQGDKTDISSIVEQLKKEKQYLFSEAVAGGASPALRTSSVKEQRSGAGAIERAAKRAAGTGSRSDLQEYMRRRRSVV